MQRQPSTVEWIWRHLAFRMPAQWEMLQFSTEFSRGRCAFADRYQFRAEVSWSAVQGEPDYDRMVSNYVSKLEQDKKLEGAERQKKQGWHGFSGRLNGEASSRFGRYLEPLGCLVEWAFIWPEARDPALEADVLASVRDAVIDRDGLQPWRAFGLDMRLPPFAALEGCTIQPARAEFAFSDPKTGNAWRFARLGMVNRWFKPPLEDWLAAALGPGTRHVMTSRRQCRGIDHVVAEGEFKPEGLHLRKGRFEVEAWIEPSDGRIYHARKMIRKIERGADIPIERLISAAPEFTSRP